MKLYSSIGPNPRVVNMFLAEKGLDIERVTVDLMAGENRREPYLKVNPAGQTPALQLDGGDFVTSRRPKGGAGGAEAPLPKMDRGLADACGAY